MSVKQSYNVQALRGSSMDDKEFQQDMSKVGVNIPDEILFTPDLGPYVINEIHKQTSNGLTQVINPDTGFNYTQEEALATANKHRKDALINYNKLLK